MEHCRQTRCDCAHHLIHSLADRAHVEFGQLLIGIGAVAAHHQIGDNRGVRRLNCKDVIAVNADGVTNFDDEIRQRVMLLNNIHRRNGDIGRRDIDLVTKQS